MNIEIRKACREDCDELTRIAYAAKRYWGYPEEYIRLWRADLTVTLDFLDRHPVYCAVAGSRVVGFYAVAGEGATRKLEHMWVDPEHIRTGVGTRLFLHAVDALRAAGVSVLRIASDPNAEGFYQQMGARHAGKVPSKPVGRELPLLLLELESRDANSAT